MPNSILITNRDKILRTMQDIELEILAEFDRICRKHDIRYSLGGGTCLGQARHGGFIPWDDDIDIDMTAENYEKFRLVAREELDPEKFFLRCRETDPHHFRSSMRIEHRKTHITMTRYNALDYDPNVGVFIDIFRWNYLPDNAFQRKIASNLLYFIRTLEDYKELNVITRGLSRKAHLPLLICGKLFSGNAAVKMEERIVRRCERKKTGWIVPDSLINGNYGGHPSEGIDEYRDVAFENLTVMNKTHVDEFLSTLYGKIYMEWLPPQKRLTNHLWTAIDLGPYASRYDLPGDYSEYLSVRLSEDKLRRMQELSLEMLEWIDSVCRAAGIRYYRAVLKPAGSGFNADGKLWSGPIRIAMLREDYEKFPGACREHPDPRYIYQSHETDPENRYTHARIRLEYTMLRERRIPSLLESYHRGLFIDVIPLDRMPADAEARKKAVAKIRRLNRQIRLKWRKSLPKQFMDADLKTKCKLIALKPFSDESMRGKLADLLRRCDDPASGVYIDGTGIELNGFRLEGFDQESCDQPDCGRKGARRFETKGAQKEAPSTWEELSAALAKSYGYCHLNYYDNPEYQLSMMRYDHETDRLLTNEELTGHR